MPLLIALLLALAPAADPYLAAIAEWRGARAKRLTSETGWLTVAGLVWLKEGRNTVGSAAAADVALPSSAPATVGHILVSGRKVEFVAARGITPTSGGRPVERLALDDENVGIEVGSVTLSVIERASRLAVRIRDRNAPTRLGFSGLRWYPADARWRVPARLTAPQTPRSVPIATIVGDRIEMESAGELAFTIGGRQLRLEAVFDSPERNELFVMFKDRTNGDATYGAGRYMYLPLPVDGIVDLDFNRAYNPPCAYTDFATCPLPPSQNWLPVAIDAGEKNYERGSKGPRP